MERTKTAAIVFIISVGIIASYVILKNSAPEYDSTKNGFVEANSTSSISQNPIKWLSKAVEKISDFAGGDENNEVKISLPENVDFENINLTEFIAKSSFTQMKNLDQSGKDPFSIDPNDPASREFIEKAIAGIGDPSTLFNFTISDKDLKISQDNSLENKKKYIDNFGKVVIKNVNNDIYRNSDKAVAAVANGDISGVKKLADIYKIFFNEVVDISIPSDYLKIHKDYLAILKKMEIIYRGLSDLQNDPIKAALLTQLWPETLKAEAEFLKVSRINN